MAVHYPIAADADAALSAPLGRAARERDARLMAGCDVVFARELTGPVYESRQAAEAGYAGRVDGPGLPAVPPDDRYCDLMEVALPSPLGGQAEPIFQAGSRWPKPTRELPTGWRLSVAYWRLADDVGTSPSGLPQARSARRGGNPQVLDAAALRALASQPLQAVKPQRALDIGLFEVRLPEAPDIIMPDE